MTSMDLNGRKQKMNNTIQEDILGEEMHNTGKQNFKWTTNVHENRKNVNLPNSYMMPGDDIN